jgi:hypothetical protein
MFANAITAVREQQLPNEFAARLLHSPTKEN